jgi:hypothetical protein
VAVSRSCFIDRRFRQPSGSPPDSDGAYLTGVTVTSLTVPDFETEAVKENASPLSLLMITLDRPLTSTSSGETQRALVNVGGTILPTLSNEALNALASLGLKTESRFSSKSRCTVLPDLNSMRSRRPDLSITRVLDWSGDTNFIGSAAKTAEAVTKRKGILRNGFMSLKGCGCFRWEIPGWQEEKRPCRPAHSRYGQGLACIAMSTSLRILRDACGLVGFNTPRGVVQGCLR